MKKIILAILIFLSFSSQAMELTFTPTLGLGIRLGDTIENQNTGERESTSMFYIQGKVSFLKTKVDLGQTEFHFLAVGANLLDDKIEYSISPIMLVSPRHNTSIGVDIFKENKDVPEQSKVGLSIGWSF